MQFSRDLDHVEWLQISAVRPCLTGVSQVDVGELFAVRGSRYAVQTVRRVPQTVSCLPFAVVGMP